MAGREVRFTRDWRRVRCLDPDADTALLEGMESELRRRLAEEPGGKLMRILEESLSLNVQMTEPKAYLAESLPAGMEELMRLYVEPQAAGAGAAAERARGDPGADARGVRARRGVGSAEKENRGVGVHAAGRSAAHRRGIPAQRSGAHVSCGELRPGLEMAKVLAFSAAALRAGVERVEKAELELTAVIEPAARVGATDEEPERLEMYRFGVETMEEHQIRVLTTSDMGRVAETARRELRV